MKYCRGEVFGIGGAHIVVENLEVPPISDVRLMRYVLSSDDSSLFLDNSS